MRIHVLDTGDPGPAAAGPALLLVPGWTMPASIWAGSARALGRARRVIAVDPRGQGGSAWTPGMDLSPDRRARDLGEVVDALRPGPVVVVGWSLGAVEAARWAGGASPGTVRGLVLVDEPLYDSPARGAARDRFRGQLRADRPATIEAFVRGMFVRPQPRAILAALTRESLRCPAAAGLELLDGEAGDLAALCRPATVPVMVILTSRLAAEGQRFRAEAPGVRVEVVPRCGHAVFLDAPDRFNALVESFVRSLAP